ncbi:hypothetical protein FRB93_006831 [Tulasnella sp. JGI-2019a]|nr:hypothetical protein FRB93_006831 [Tulasnella sp. JGI-2019a]
MAQRALGKQWTPEEDESLVQAVRTYGEDTECWKQIAAAVPGRTNKACRKRWKHSLHPSVKKTNWNAEEDELLLELHAKHPGRWALIASNIPGRTDDACAKRYCEALDPKLNKTDWTTSEDELLLESFSRLGSAWTKVAEELGRSGLGCRNRWRLLERRRKGLERKAKKAKEGAGSASGLGTRKRKRIVAAEPGFTEDDQEPGPSKRRPSQPSVSNGRFLQPSTSTSFDSPDRYSSHTPTPTNIHTSIDPSIISMALGKCGCGCGTGLKPCMCSSVTPALTFDLASSSIDWDQLFPYLHAELPNVFVDPPMHMEGGSQAYMQAISTLLGDDSGCRCQAGGDSAGCCSGLTGATPGVGLSCCSGGRTGTTGCCVTSTASTTVASSSGCCSSSAEVELPSCCGGGEQPQLRDPSTPGSNVDAEAAKFVLDYASFMQRQGKARQLSLSTVSTYPTSLLSPAPPNLDSSGPSCQMSASQVLIGLIDKYQQQQQQQRSQSSSRTHSASLQSVPLPAQGGCCCGTPTSPPSPPRPQVAETNPYQTSSVSGGCSAPSKPANQSQAQAQAGPPVSLPSYLPGCPCGCNDRSRGSGPMTEECSCGCVGMCLCGTQMALDFAANSSSEQGQASQMTPVNAMDYDLTSLDQYQTATMSSIGQISASDYLVLTSAPASAFLPSPQETFFAGSSITAPSASSAYPSDIQSILPSVIPGCGCGCGDGVSEGSCECGCVGVCMCSKYTNIGMERTQLRTGREGTLGAWTTNGAFNGESLRSEVSNVEAVADTAKAVAAPSPPIRSCCTARSAAAPEVSLTQSTTPSQSQQITIINDASSAWSAHEPIQAQSYAVKAMSKISTLPSPHLKPTLDTSFPASLSSNSSTPTVTAPTNTSTPTSTTPTTSKKLNTTRLSGFVASPVSTYACGHPSCWVESPSLLSASSSLSEVVPNALASFRTSSELLDHRRTAHGAEDEAEGSGGGNGSGLDGLWVFRCALRGCGKGWKSINGIQYHLQLSKAHFQSALDEESMKNKITDADEQDLSPIPTAGLKHHLRRTSSISASPISMPCMDGNSLLPQEAVTKKPKSFPCTHEGCHNTYKQVAGLKYHLVHGHTTVRPVQLSSIPPALSRKISGGGQTSNKE